MGFIMLRLARGVRHIIYILLSVSVIFLVSTFEIFRGFREFFPRLSAIFLSGRGNLNVVYEV